MITKKRLNHVLIAMGLTLLISIDCIAILILACRYTNARLNSVRIGMTHGQAEQQLRFYREVKLPPSSSYYPWARSASNSKVFLYRYDFVGLPYSVTEYFMLSFYIAYDKAGKVVATRDDD